MRFRTFLTYLSLLPLSACTRSCKHYDNNEEFAQAKLPLYSETGADPARSYSGRFVEQMRAMSFLNFAEYVSSNRRPVRLLVRKLSRQQRIISGTFEGYLYGEVSGHASLGVTDGRFEVKD